MKAVNIRVQRGAFVHEESFRSRADGEAWKQMILETLDMPQARALDLHTYAAGLAATVRECGGGYTRRCWLDPSCDPHRWAQGLVVPPPRELTEQVLDMLRGTRRG